MPPAPEGKPAIIGFSSPLKARGSLRNIESLHYDSKVAVHRPIQHAGARMKIHEYQAKEILRKYGVAVPNGEMAISFEEADSAAKALFSAGHAVVVIKAQIHAGGRGKGGGVKLAKTLDEAAAASKAILGMQLITHQTGPEGQKVQRLLIEEGSAIDRELYLGLVLDRASAKVVFMASQSGGMEIEQVAHDTPERA